MSVNYVPLSVVLLALILATGADVKHKKTEERPINNGTVGASPIPRVPRSLLDRLEVPGYFDPELGPIILDAPSSEEYTDGPLQSETDSSAIATDGGVDPCSKNMLFRALIQSETWERMLSEKRKNVYIRREMLESISEEVGRKYTYLFDKSFSSLSMNKSTYLLAFGSADEKAQDAFPDPNRADRCVWLLSSEMIIASQAVPLLRPGLLDGLRNDLGVKTREVARFPAVRREGEECDTPLVVESGDRRPEQLRNARGALKRAADVMIPGSVAYELQKVATAAAGKKSTKPTLLILPNEDVASYPFAALPLADGDLVDWFDISVLSSIEDLLYVREVRPRLPVKMKEVEALIVGAPDLSADKTACWRDLPYAKLEAQYVAQQFGVERAIIGKEASYKRVRTLLRAHKKSLRLIYFATHGIADQRNPADQSYLALRGQYLRGADLRWVNLDNSPLVVLSACQSGLGKVFPGGIFGLAQAWRYAGAEQVVVSLWNVSDAGTYMLMRHFIDALVKRKLDPEVALSEAMRTLKKSQPDPAIWAAFVYYGRPALNNQ